MSRHRFTKAAFSALVMALLATAWASPNALAGGQGAYSLEILVDGRPAHEYFHDGRAYVEALKGREYSIRLRNLTGERVAVALSVDGMNSIDAKVATAREASKWILEPWQTLTLDGWQTSSSTARRFFFTSEENSYGAWLGQTRNLGLIAAAVFREKRPAPAPWSRFGERREESFDKDDSRQARPAAPSEEGKGEAAGASPREDAMRQSEAEGSFRSKPVPDELAATGIGREVGHSVRRIEFDEESVPSAVLEIRYEYRDALVRLGVVPPRHAPDDRLARRESARGFEEFGYSPDPYRRGRRNHRR